MEHPDLNYSGNKIINLKNTNFSGTLNIPEGTEIIGKIAFKNSLISQIKIPKTVKIIEEEAFSECFNLNKVVFEENSQLEKIEKKNF